MYQQLKTIDDYINRLRLQNHVFHFSMIIETGTLNTNISKIQTVVRSMAFLTNLLKQLNI